MFASHANEMMHQLNARQLSPAAVSASFAFVSLGQVRRGSTDRQYAKARKAAACTS